MRRFLDRVTGSVTMYKLMLILLGVIAVVALLLSFFGQFRSGPVELLVSLGVSNAVAVGASALFAKLFRLAPHLESALITGVLVGMILPPTLNPLGLAGIAAASLLAAASKYLIAVRGRHILNPAAFGVLVVSLVSAFTGLGLGFQTWWPGTPFLLAPVLIGAFLVLYRTQHLALGAVFVAVVIAVRLIVGVATAAPLDQVLSFTILQGPIFFLAGFMLSEPLTLPPRRWQQLLVGSIVGLLFALPTNLLGLAPFTITPALALLVGNLVAFGFGQRRGIRLAYTGKRQLADDTWEVAFQPQRPVRFQPGQFMELTVPHRRADQRGDRRYFSITSAPVVDGPLTFGLTIGPTGSSFKRALLALEPGARVHATSVGGDFVLPADPTIPVLLVAGGIGITPFASQLARHAQSAPGRDVTVVYATRATGGIPYSDLLEQCGVPVVLFAPESPRPLPPNWVYAGEGRVTAERLAEYVPDVARRAVYISGPPGLVHDLRRALRGVGARRIRTDAFSGY